MSATEAQRDEPKPSTSQSSWRMCLVASDIAQLAAAGLLLDYVLFIGTDVSWLLRWSAIGVLLFAVTRSHIWLFLLSIQVGLLVREPSRPDMAPGLDSFLYCFSALALVAYASSFQMTRRHISHLGASSFARAFRRGRTAPPVQSSSSESLGMPTHLRELLALRALTLMGVVLVSMLAFTQLPFSRVGRQQWWQRSVSNDLTLWPGPTILIVAIALVVLFWQSEWRQITPAQARVVLRSTLVSSHYRDLKMIVTRRLRTAKKDAIRQARERTASKPAAAEAADK